MIAAVLADPTCAAILDRMPSLHLPDWWLTAGAVFQNIWNALEGRPPGWGIKDYDVFYFDASDLSWHAEDRVIRAAAELFADLGAVIEIRNQARVHLWYESRYGAACAPFTSTRDAIDAFASTTCCLGVTRDAPVVGSTPPRAVRPGRRLRHAPAPASAPRPAARVRREGRGLHGALAVRFTTPGDRTVQPV